MSSDNETVNQIANAIPETMLSDNEAVNEITNAIPETMSSNDEITNAMRKVILRASDGEEFEVEEAVAMESRIAKNYLEDNDSDNVIPLPRVGAKSLARIVQYCTRRVELRASGGEGEGEGVKDLGAEFVRDVKDNQHLKELVLAANYLDIEELFRLVAQEVADRIKNRSVEFVRDFFGVESDFTPEEEEEMRKAHFWAFEGVEEDDQGFAN